jgi:hypothetical protein
LGDGDHDDIVAVGSDIGLCWRLIDGDAVVGAHDRHACPGKGQRGGGSDDPSLRISQSRRRTDVGDVDGSVATIAGSGGARPEQLSLVVRQPEGSTPDPSVTVVICAHTEDRWDDLVAAVMSVKQQTRRPAEIVLVIDHNPKLERRSTFELPGLKVIPNDNEKGLPGCRNAGIAAATAEIVAFLDDETVATRNWLAALVAPYADPHVLGVGGQAVPVWQAGRPGWFPPEFNWVVGCSYRGMPAERTLVHHFIGGTCRCGVASLSNAVGSMLRSMGSAPDDSLARRRRFASA